VTVSPLFSVFFHGYVNPAWYDGLSDANKAALEAAGAEGKMLLDMISKM
jgi:C4-dicarboxylate-binding protein DctP